MPLLRLLTLCPLLLCLAPPPGFQPLVDRGDAALQRRGAVLLYRGAPFTGVLRERDRSGESRTPFLRGREHGWAYGAYPDGARRFERLFLDGRKEGTHRGYWENGAPQFVYRYEHDAFEGEQLSYFRGGQRAELRHYRRGQEEGLQRAWGLDGSLLANYTFRGGRRYGVVGRFDCVSVHQR